MIFKDLIQVFSVQLNLIFLIVIYNQQNKIDSLIDNIKEVEEKIDKYHNEFENIMKLNDNVIEKSEELTNYLNFYPSSRILLLISSVMFILKLIKVYQSTLWFMSSFQTLNLIPFLITKSKLFSYIFHKNEIIELVDDSFFFQVILKDNQLTNINIKDSVENNYEDLSIYILRILQKLSDLEMREIMENPVTTEVLNNFITSIENI